MEFIPYLIAFGAVLAIVAISFLIAIAFRRVVPTNMVHIVQSKKETKPYGSGKKDGNVYYAWPSSWPFIGVSVIELPESVFVIGLEDYDAYDLGRLPFMVDIKAFFRISDSAKAAQRVAGFNELKSQLEAILQGVVRRILSTNKLEEIMQERSGLSEEFTKEVDEQLLELGVCTAKCIEFMDIRDASNSKVIANMMAKEQSRIDRESRTSVAENQRQAQEAEIEAKRSVDMRKQDATQQVGIRQAEVERDVGLSKEKANQQVQAEAAVTAQREMEVVSVKENRQAEIQKQVSITNAEMRKQVDITNADAQRQVLVTKAQADRAVVVERAEGDKESKSRIAEGDLAAALKNAEGTKAVGLAQAEAATAMALAPVKAQVELAEKVGANPDYQEYMIRLRQVEVSGEVGKEMALALREANLNVIANGGGAGSIQEGVGGLMDMFTSKGGTNIAGLLAGMAQTEQGAALVKRLTGNN